MHIVVAENFSSVSMVVFFFAFFTYIFTKHIDEKENQIFIQFIQCMYAYIHVPEDIKKTQNKSALTEKPIVTLDLCFSRWAHLHFNLCVC